MIGLLDILKFLIQTFDQIMWDIAFIVQPFDEELWKVITQQNPDLAKQCLDTNYYGMKRITEALLPLLQLSTSPRIVNVSSILGMLKVRHSTNSKFIVLSDRLSLLLEIKFIVSVHSWRVDQTHPGRRW